MACGKGASGGVDTYHARSGGIGLIRRNKNIGGVKQQRANLTVLRTQIDSARKIQHAFARHFRSAAIARLRSACGAGRAIIARDVVGPYNDFATITRVDGIRLDADIRPDVSTEGILHICVFALEIAANQHAAATIGATGVYAGFAIQPDEVAEEFDVAAFAFDAR